MSNEQLQPERPIDSVSYKELQRMFMFKEVAEGVADPKLRNDAVSDWINVNGQLYEDFFTDEDRGYEIVRDYRRAKAAGEDEAKRYANSLLEHYKEWRARRTSTT